MDYSDHSYFDYKVNVGKLFLTVLGKFLPVKLSPGKFQPIEVPPGKSLGKIPTQKIPTSNIPTHFLNSLSPLFLHLILGSKVEGERRVYMYILMG